MVEFLADKPFLMGEKPKWPDFMFYEALDLYNSVRPGFVVGCSEKL